MTIPNTVILKNRKYEFVKEYPTYVRYKEAEVGYMICFSKQELGLITEVVKPIRHIRVIGRRVL